MGIMPLLSPAHLLDKLADQNDIRRTWVGHSLGKVCQCCIGQAELPLASTSDESADHSFQCNRYALPPADAERHNTTPQVLALHCMEETRD
jgi:hypothetical protein